MPSPDAGAQVTPDEINEIKGRLTALGKGNGYQRNAAQDIFIEHAEGDIAHLLDEVERLQNMLQNANNLGAQQERKDQHRGLSQDPQPL